MIDGETARAMIAAQLWAAGSATQRQKPAASLLTVADDLIKRSYALGAPVSGENPDVLYIDPTPFSAVRFREWLARQTPDVQSLYTEPQP